MSYGKMNAWARLFGAGLWALMALGGCGGGASSELASPPANLGEAQRGHFERLQELRAAVGVGPLSWSSSLALAAQGHADYQRANGYFGHYEQPGSSGFTGEGVSDRTRAAGYGIDFLAAETVAGGYPSEREQGRALMDLLWSSPGHRMVLSMPEMKEAGIGGDPLTTVLASRGGYVPPVSGGVAAYPFDGQKNVPRAWSFAGAAPAGVEGHATGQPISFSKMLGSRVEMLDFRLQEADSGEPVEFAAENSDRAAQAVAYPLSSLKPRTAYAYSATLRVDGVALEKRARFETGD